MSDKTKAELDETFDWAEDYLRKIFDKFDAAQVIISIRTNKGDFGCMDLHYEPVNLPLTKSLLDRSYKRIEEKSQKESKGIVKIIKF